MRKLLLILTIIFTVLSIIFTALPMDTLAFLPIGLALILGLFLLKSSKENQKKIPNGLLFLSAVCSAIVLGKILFVKDEVVKDEAFEKQKIETKEEAKQELEELENDLE